jgi:PAS domain S-box-containing protein
VISFFQKLFDTSDFPPRWHCGVWTQGHGWLHILSDLAIFAAYAAIPIALTYFIRRRKDVPFLPIFWLFAAFIIFCGLTHLIEATIFWHPWYRLAGVVKAVTAIVSWMTVFALIKVIPKAVKLPSLEYIENLLTEETTERMQAEAALREQKHFLDRITSVSPDVQYVIDLTSSIFKWVSPQSFNRLGYHAEEIIAMGAEFMPQVMHPDDLALMPAHFAELADAEDGQTIEIEYRLRRPGGDWRWFHGRKTPFSRDEKGRVREVIGTSVEITERKTMELSLRRNADLFSKIIDQAPSGMYVVDHDFRLQQVNEVAMPVFRNVDPIAGHDFNEVMVILWGEELGREIAKIFRNTLETGERFVSPRFTEIRNDIREQQSFEWETQQITMPDGKTGVVCYFEDITKKIKAEDDRQANAQRMRLATEATQVGVWEWNVITGELRWDDQLFRIYGIKPTPDRLLNYDDWRNALVPEQLEENERILQETIRTCGKSTREFNINRRDDGALRLIRAVETVRTNAEGEAEWVVGTNLDITKQKQAEQAIIDEAKRKDEFLAMLGHELRNPLNAIRHAVDVCKETPDDMESIGWACGVIDRQSNQLSRMVDDLLDVARVNQGRIDLRLDNLNIGGVVEGAVESLRSLIEQRKHTLEVVIKEQLMVKGDAARLEQVFVNLLTNAARYTPEGGHISLECEAEGDNVLVRVKDNGSGIPADLLPHIFDLFRQAESALDRAAGGLGIGMRVVKSLVEMHGGLVNVTSPGKGKGTTVRVLLPVITDLKCEPAVRGTASTVETSKKSLRVLIVDDHKDAANGLSLLLTRRNCNVRLAHSGPEGLEAALDFMPDVLLLDIGLPGFDGYQLIGRLQATGKFEMALFIAISGYAQRGDHDQCLASGFHFHFSKPIDVPELLEKITEWEVA